MNIKFDKKTPINILLLGAHCDDIEIGAGGTLLKLLEEYEVGQVLWITFASNEIRKKEAISSAELFLSGVKNKTIVVNSFRDGYFPFQGAEIKEYFETLKNEITPDLIFTHYRNDRHQDHRLISDLTWNTWRNNLILEYEILKWDGDLGNPNVYIELPKKILSQKIKIIHENFKSQHTKHWFDNEALSALARIRGTESNVNYAEGFYGRKMRLL